MLPDMGFPTHPHREMEIVTVMLAGEMTHHDSMGNTIIMRAGDVQRMSAGTGLTHSEFNLGDEPVHFYQIWIFPDTANLNPSYDQRTYDPASFRNVLFPLASGQNMANAVSFFTNATIYRSILESGNSIQFNTDDSRQIFIYVSSGQITANGISLHKKDQARINIETSLKIFATDETDFILIDVPSCKGWGYNENTLRGAKA